MAIVTIKIKCENEDQASIYLNAYRYKNALYEINNYLRNQDKHADPCDDISIIRQNFYEITNGLLDD